jgi:hypothetical protein
LVAAVLLVCLSGCATATIARRDGPDNEARIVSSDAGAIHVRARNGLTYRIPREAVIGIDHPGNVEVVFGAILLVLAGALFADLRDEGNSDALPISLVYGIPGVTLLATGLARYIPSVTAASEFTPAPAMPAPGYGPAPVPPIPPGGIWVPPPAGAAPAGTAPATPPPPSTTPPAPPEEPEVVPGST